MKVLVDTVEGKGLESLMGQRVTLFCAAYIYTGKLVGVNDTCVQLHDAAVVYQTGAFSTPTWEDAQPLPHDWYVALNAVESFGILKV